MNDTSASELLERARAGDQKALQAVLERHQAQVYRFGMRMCRDPEDAKDVLQETLLAAARGMQDFRGDAALSTWLYSVARSFCIKKRRGRKHVPAAVDSLDAQAAQVADSALAADDALASKELEHALDAAIAGLAPMYREVLVLRDVEGLSAAEVAEVLGIGVPAVKSRLHRARLAVRAKLSPMLAESPPAAAPTDAADARDEPAGACPDVLALLSQHLEGEISPAVCADMQAHVDRCARCNVACDSLKRTLALCRSSGPRVELPADVQAAVRTAVNTALRARLGV